MKLCKDLTFSRVKNEGLHSDFLHSPSCKICLAKYHECATCAVGTDYQCLLNIGGL
jgi:hypothetical protein